MDLEDFKHVFIKGPGILQNDTDLIHRGGGSKKVRKFNTHVLNGPSADSSAKYSFANH